VLVDWETGKLVNGYQCTNYQYTNE
jgi:hypothetical protein